MRNYRKPYKSGTIATCFQYLVGRAFKSNEFVRQVGPSSAKCRTLSNLIRTRCAFDKQFNNIQQKRANKRMIR